MRHLLHHGDNHKLAIDYLNKIKDLIEKSPQPTAKYCNNDIIDKLENDIIFDFDKKKTKNKFSINDEDIEFHLNVKNLFDGNDEDILVQIFEMNTMSYYRDKLQEFDITEINLDGLTSKYTLKIPVKSNDKYNEMLNKYQIKKYIISFPSELLHKRGVIS